MANSGEARPTDWGQASERFDEIVEFAGFADLLSANEAQTRFDVIDRILKEVLSWRHGQISVEEFESGPRKEYVDYVLRTGDRVIVVEAKKSGVSFPSPTKRKQLKLGGTVLKHGPIASAISQAAGYAKSLNADIAIVTNGVVWCYFRPDFTADDYAGILFPLSDAEDAESLWNVFSERKVHEGSLDSITSRPTVGERRLISSIERVDGRVDRNNIADHITQALNHALYADALLIEDENLEKCFVTTEARVKFDSLLGAHIADPKPESVYPAERIKASKKNGPLERLVNAPKDFSPPVTLIIGPVGAGKSTYLAHFERISGRETLEKRKAHWIYIDFELMGPSGNPREFLYRAIRQYFISSQPGRGTDYKTLVEPAYKEEIAGLASGPLAPLFMADRNAFNIEVARYIQRDYEAIEPYVDKLLAFLKKSTPCIIVLDNIDLFENDALETNVFAEGIALSKRSYCSVIMSLRDTTFVKHRTGSIFDAYELRKLWLDPPPFKEVLSARLSYSRKILKQVSVTIETGRGIPFIVPDISVFFDVVQKSLLSGLSGNFIDSVSDLNIRRGLSLVNNFLTSGHVRAESALLSYISGDTGFSFPFHEIFKGTMLSQWRHFREDRAECPNIFDSRLSHRRLRLLRAHLLQFLLQRAHERDTNEVQMDEIIEKFSHLGASEDNLVSVISSLWKHALIRTSDSAPVSINSAIHISRSGAYFIKLLSHRMVYLEETMHDTAIEDLEVWKRLSALTNSIELLASSPEKMRFRKERLMLFVQYLENLEGELNLSSAGLQNIAIIPDIKASISGEMEYAIKQSETYT